MKKWMVTVYILILFGKLVVGAHESEEIKRGDFIPSYFDIVEVHNGVQDGEESRYVEAVLIQVNRERQRAGLSPLAMSPGLARLAAVRAEEISRVYSHTRPDGSDVTDAVSPDHRHYVGENIAAGYHTPQEVVDGWMTSKGHRDNILRRDFKEIGIGYYHTNTGPYQDYWVQVFRG